MSRDSSNATMWRIIAILSIVSAGAYVGNESAAYFWDLASYVTALDSEYPYRFAEGYPFLYPPFTADVFSLARSHLFELLSIAYVGSIVYFLNALARLEMPRTFEWLFAITAMGGLGVVSLQSGNLAILMNLGVLALAWEAAMGRSSSLRFLPIAIGIGALLKPQFALYLGLIALVEPSRRTAVVKMLAAGLGAAAVYALYILFRPFDWNEYVQAIVKRAVIEKDYAWGPAGFIKIFTASDRAVFAGYVATFVAVGTLAYAAWRKSAQAGQPISRVSMVSLGFVVLTFANPRLPLYDLYAAGIALAVCCAAANWPRRWLWLLGALLAINLSPWSIANFARTPAAFPWWMTHLQIGHLSGIAGLLIGLSRTGLHAAADRE